jgi:hypothetical protein
MDVTPTQRPPEMQAWTLPVFEHVERVETRIAELQTSLNTVASQGDRDKLGDEVRRLRRERTKLDSQFVPTMITKAVQPAEIRILPRGNWMDRSGKVVEPRTPHFLRQIDTGRRRPDRLDLAQWLVARDNPLTARVVVNRLWKLFFGVGLSKELIDLGSRGEVPPNQELLDCLTVEFMESGWNIKHTVRSIVISAAYRQSSLTRADLEALDPENRLVARQSRFRMEAEQIRDNALAVSGLLVRKVGGELVRPYQPARYYSALNFPEREYTPSTGDDQFRRAVYVHWQRQFLHPWLLAFDAPTREECTAQRPISSTPAAALVLLNDPTFVEAARALAAEVLTKAPPHDDERIRWAWRKVLGREAKPEEVRALAELLGKHRAEFAAQKQSAAELLNVGISPHAAEIDVAEHAAWTSASRVLLNLNETITRN